MKIKKLFQNSGLSLVELLVAMSMLSGLFFVSNGFVYNLIQQSAQYHKTNNRLAFEKELNTLFSQPSLCTCNLAGATPMSIPDVGSVSVSGLRTNCAAATNDFYQQSPSGFVRDPTLTVADISIANATLVSGSTYSAPVTVRYAAPAGGQVGLQDGRYLLMFDKTAAAGPPYTISSCYLAPQLPPNPTAWLLGGNAGLTSFNFVGTTNDTDILFQAESTSGGFIKKNATAWGLNALKNDSGTENTASGSNALQSNSTGAGNTAQGQNALVSNSSGSNNTAFGFWALIANTSGSENTAIGYQALGANATGTGNTAAGLSALSQNSNGSFNSATNVGGLGTSQASFNTSIAGGQSRNTTGNSNTSMGQQALEVNTIGAFNVAFGNFNSYTSLGTQNTAFGTSAMIAASGTASYNTALGVASLNNNSAGSSNYNSAVGNYSLSYLVNGTNNTSFGYCSACGPSGSSQNTTFGSSTSLNSNLTSATTFGSFSMIGIAGVNNTAFGEYTLMGGDGTATDNTAIGYQSLRASPSTGIGSTSAGTYALFTAAVSSNTAIGYQALENTYVGTLNVAVGSQALFNTTASNNVAVGDRAGFSINGSGANNTMIGSQAMASNSTATGSNNSSMGTKTLFLNTTGSDNLALGYSSLYSNSIGSANTAIGSDALYLNDNGNSNTAIGSEALKGITNGTKNTAIGYAAGEFDSSGSSYFANGSQNTFVGANTGVQNTGTTYNNSTAIGYGAIIGGNNTIVLGGSGALAVSVGIGVSAPTFQLQLYNDSAGKPGTYTWATSSDLRLKDVRGPFTRSLASLEGIRPVYYKYKPDNAMDLPSTNENVGVVAQNAKAFVPESVSTNSKGYLTVRLDAIIWTMLNAIKELAQIILGDSESLKIEIAEINQAYNSLQSQNRALKEKNTAYKAYLCGQDKNAPFCSTN